ncbi:amidohydrolase family protein [Streptomyces sp. NEAU-Y11]|uniref:amidohydrolase family protein n=1 Tax=Streptomyces cucumeris TaxID=2962890 RepID=UPI0020C883EB|nr:amidohydrolase family protein [Streptomyces sp. NEAU-Y11]MCP9213219.1 amidohydrolase family protein [Streptomyces sp. NEAU-Y11]
MTDLLIVGGDIVTMDAARRVLPRATVAVSGNSIAALGTAEDLRARYPHAREIDASGCVVIPGLIDTHQHTTVDPLVRSTIPDHLGSHESIFDWIVPLHAHADGDDDELAATITAVECLSRGITTVLEPGTVAYPERVAAGLGAAGIRARVGGWGWDAKGVPFGAPADEVLARQDDIVRSLPTTGPVTGWVTLVGHDLVSDELFAGAASLAERLDVGLTWHISPGPADIEAYALRCGRRPVVHFRELGVLGPRLLLGHAVWLDDTEVEAILQTSTAVAVCPGAYLRLAQGYARASRHAELVRRGGRVALGCDSHNAGDAPDVLLAAYLFAGLERDRGRPDPVRAEQAFALATIDGARAIGLGERIGSLEVGKAADIVVLDARDPAWIPRGDLARQLVWGHVSRTVRDVLVDGRVVVRDRRPTGVDLEAVAAAAAERSGALLRRAAITPRPAWPTEPVAGQ